jgi:TatD DNase family protein
MLIDCHTHLDPFPDSEVRSILERAKNAGVGLVITAGTTLDTSARAVELSASFPGLFAGVGIHPMDLHGPVDENTYARLFELAASTEKVLVISEVGLDFMEGTPDQAVQYQAFREQIRLARELDLPIVFHSREAHPDTLRVLREERGYDVGGIMHYFQADLETARQAIDLGFHISLARPLLRLPALQKVAAALPLSSIVLETDATPQPFKSKRANWTEPRHVRDVAGVLAKLQKRPVEEIAAVTSRNVLGILNKRGGAIAQSLASPDKRNDEELGKQ